MRTLPHDFSLLCWRTDSSGRLEQLTAPLDTVPSHDWHAASAPWAQAVHPDDVDTLTDARTALTRGEPFQCMYRLRQGDGAYCLVVETAAPRVGDGGFAGYQGSLVALKNAGGALPAPVVREMRRREERFRSLTRMSSDWFWETDAQHRFTYISDGVWRILGLEPESLIGRSRWELADNPDQPGLLACRAKVDAWQAFSGLRYGLHSARDGRLHHVEVAGEPCFDDGIFTGYRGVAHDVTADVERAAALQRINARLNMVLESIGDAFVAVDEGWCIIYANHRMANLLDATPAELAGSRLWMTMPEPLKAALHPHFRDELKYGEVRAIEVQAADTDMCFEVRAYGGDDGISMLFHDVSEQRRAERAILRSEARLQDVIEATPGGYVRIDARGEIREANPALAEMAACRTQDLIGQAAATVFPELPLASLIAPDSPAVIKGLETRLHAHDGTRRYVSLNANIEREDGGGSPMLFGFITDITERRRTEKKLERLATEDPVTGLRNRTFIDLHLQTMLDTAARGECNAVMFVDLDRFKEVNDEHGHEAGDRLLRIIAGRLRGELRPGDLIARFGGDEFIVVAHCDGGAEAAGRIAEKLCALVAEPVDVDDDGGKATVGASIGIAIAPHDGSTVEELFRKADAAMYRVKSSGRNGWRLYQPGDEDD